MIILAVENNGWVQAYNEFGNKILEKPGKLYQYTDSTIAVKNDTLPTYTIYGEDGKTIAKYPYDFIDMSGDSDAILEVNSKK